MSYSADIAILEQKRTDFLKQYNEATAPDDRDQFLKSLGMIEDQLKKLRLLEWEEATQRLDYSEDR
jgi:hypothetical protein